MRARAQGCILRPLTCEMAAAHIRKGTVWGTRKLLRPPKRTQVFFSVELGQKLATVEHHTRLLSQRNMTARPQHMCKLRITACVPLRPHLQAPCTRSIFFWHLSQRDFTSHASERCFCVIRRFCTQVKPIALAAATKYAQHRRCCLACAPASFTFSGRHTCPGQHICPGRRTCRTAT